MKIHFMKTENFFEYNMVIVNLKILKFRISICLLLKESLS